MNRFLAVGALALAMSAPVLAIATPSFAQPVYPQRLSSDAEIRDTQEWWRVVDRANDYRNGTTAEQAVKQQAAIANSGSATDASVGRGTAGMSLSGSQSEGPAGYGPGVTCPGDSTDAAGLNWHAGEYCLPGGR